MPRACSVCNHPKKREIDAALVSGDSYRNVAKRFGISATAAFRHQEHIGKALVKAEKARLIGEIRDARSLDQKTESLVDEFLRLAKLCEETSDIRGAIVGLQQMRETWKTVYDMRAKASTSFADASDWPAAESRMVEALKPFPDAAEAVAVALEELAAER